MRKAFTLIELLVVVTIIVMLLALLAPALDSAMEQAQRAVCAANLRATAAGLSEYGVNMRRNYPDGQPAYRSKASVMYSVDGRQAQTDGMGIAVVWTVLPDYDTYDGYLGHGILGHLKYVDPRAFYCPSMTIPWMKYDNATGPGHMDLAGKTNVQTKTGGWPASNDPRGDEYTFIYTAYHYRASFDGPADLDRFPGRPALPWRSASMRKDSGQEPILADVFAEPGPNNTGRHVDHHHRVGYNVARLDASVVFTADPRREVFRAHNGGQPYNAGPAEYLTQRWVWERFFARR